MEREGKLEEGSLRTAKSYARIHKYQPYTAVRGLIGALQHGAGIDLDVHCPTPTPPNAERHISDLVRQGALILLSDQEKAQVLDKFHSECFLWFDCRCRLSLHLAAAFWYLQWSQVIQEKQT